MHTSPLALTDDQRNNAVECGKVVLTNRQIVFLRNRGLIAAPGEWYYHSTGTFALAPTHPDARHDKAGRRKRCSLVVVTTRKAA